MSASVGIAFAALSLAALTALLTFGPMRRDLELCKKQRLELRRNLQVVIAAVIATLPLDKRVELLADIDEELRPEGS